MTISEDTTVREVVCQLLDYMRNAHLRMVLGDPERSRAFLYDADAALAKLVNLYRDDAENEAHAGRVLYEVIAERQVALRELVDQSAANPMSSIAVVEFVEKPLKR